MAYKSLMFAERRITLRPLIVLATSSFRAHVVAPLFPVTTAIVD
jgi:hypothetical protein